MREPTLDYPRLLATNELIGKISDTTYWLCITRTVQESKLFPVPSYMLLNAFISAATRRS